MKRIFLIKSFILFLLVLMTILVKSQISTLIPNDKFGDDPSYQQIVINSWIYSGSWSVNYGGIHIDQMIDVSEEGILPDGTGVGEEIQNLLNYLNQNYPNETKIVYFPEGSYTIDKPLTIPDKTIIKGAGGDENEPLQTHFHFQFPVGGADGECIRFVSSQNSGIEDIYLIDDNQPGWGYVWDGNGFILVFLHEYKDLVVFGETAENCWMRGVECNQTRRFHVNIYGENITISGCYFHDAWDYSDDGGRGYGVCLSRYSLFCRVENNIFSHLRHSIVLQYDAKQNVVAYNYSRDTHGFNGGIPWDNHLSDLCFHGRNDASVGPAWNLCEGNYVERIYFDDEHEQNGPYNAIMRCHAEDDDKGMKVYKVQGSNHQFMQNVIGTKATPFYDFVLQNFTEKWIEENGYAIYWDDSPDWSNIPSSECSYYKLQRPAFYDQQITWLPWPYLADGIIPAKYRYDRNNGYYQNDPPTTEVVNTGWESYTNICGPPNLHFTNGNTVNNLQREFLAMDEIEAGPYIIGSNNSIIYKCENSIHLKPGFQVTANNNYFFAKVGSACENKNLNVLLLNSEIDPIELFLFTERSDTNKTLINEGLFNNESNISDEKKKNQVYIYPNPNSGIFNLKVSDLVGFPCNLFISNANGDLIFNKCIENSGDFQIDLKVFPKGLYIIKLNSQYLIFTDKIIIQ